MIVNSNIHTKDQIIESLKDVFDRTHKYCQEQPDHLFAKPIREDKWSTAQNLEHLCSSAFPLTKGMSLPKIFLKTTYGANNRAEKDIDQLYAKYKRVLGEGVVAPPKYSPNDISKDQKEEILGKFQYAKEKLIKVLQKWDEKSLSKYVLPHPALGKLTIREFMFFTIFHTEHHLNTIKSLKTN